MFEGSYKVLVRSDTLTAKHLQQALPITRTEHNPRALQLSAPAGWPGATPSMAEAEHRFGSVLAPQIHRLRNRALFRGDHWMAAPIPLPAVLACFAADGRFFALADCENAVCCDTKAAEVLFHGVRATLPKREVVLAGAAVVAVPLDGDTG